MADVTPIAAWTAPGRTTEAATAPSPGAVERIGRGSLRRRLVLPVLLVLLPLLALRAFEISGKYARDRAAAESALVKQATALAAEIDQTATDIAALATVLVAPLSVQTGDVPRLRAGLSSIAATQPDLALSLAAGDDVSPEPARAIAGGAGGARFTNLMVPGNPNAPALGIAVGLTLADKTPLTLNIAVGQARLQGLLARLPLSEGWISSIMDGSDRVVARNVNAANFVGTFGTPAVRAGLAAASEGFVRARNFEGVESSIAFARAPVTGFAAVIAIPSAVFDQPVRAALARMVGTGLLVAIPAVLAALLMARGISRSLRRAAEAIARGAIPESGFAEIGALAAAFRATTTARDAVRIDLSAQNKQFLHLLDWLPIAVIIVDRDAVVSFTNRKARTYLHDGPFATPQDRDAMFHPDDRAALRAWRSLWMANKSPDPAMFRYLIGGVHRWLLFHAIVIPGFHDRASAYVTVVIDIHDTQEARIALKQANETLEARVAERTRELSETAARLTAELSRREQVQDALLRSRKQEALGRLTGGVAHDVNNVLAVISNSYETIELTSAHPLTRESIASGRAAVEHAASLVRHLLAFGRQHPLTFTVIDTAAVLAEVTDLCRHALSGDVGLEVDLADSLWPIAIDRPLLQAAMLNLVTNARDAMRGGGVIRVTARNVAAVQQDAGQPAGVRGDCVAISVRDTGIGMTEAQIQRATEPFFTSKTETGGSGLGLAMVDGFVGQSGGFLRIESAPAQGCAVTMFLPRDQGPKRQSQASEPGPRIQETSGRGTVLLVEDNITLLRSTSLLLRTLGFATLEAAQASVALDFIEKRPEIDVVVTDIMMPGKSGIGLADEVGVRRPNLPVIFVTGFAPDEGALRGRRLLRKPFHTADLLAAIESVLPGRQAGQHAAQ